MRLLILHEHQLLAQALGGLVSELCGLELMGVCSEAEEAVGMIAASPPDLLILDLELPGGEWRLAVEALRRANNQARIVCLTPAGAPWMPPPDLEPIVLAVVDKTLALNDLLAVMSDWLRRCSGGRDQNTPPVLPTELELERLNPREMRVFRALGRGLLNKQIAAELQLSPATVDTYRKSISTKLNLSGPELVRAAVLDRVSGGVLRG